MKFSIICTGVLAVWPVVHCLGQTNATSGQSINLIAAQVGNPTAVANSRSFSGFPIIGPLNLNDQRRGLGIGQQGFGTTIGQQGTTLIEPAMVPGFGLTASQGSAFIAGPQDVATAFDGQNPPIVAPSLASGPSGLATGFVGRRGLGLIGPQTPGTTAVGSQIIALAINAQNSTLTIGTPGVGNTGSGRLNPTTSLSQTRVFTVPGIPHTTFAGRVTVTHGR